ncbi:ABI family protein [Dioscorea alata]|uniref:ABI family protein n=1 Tax=Dioscorea alata TaxID=55571 RepID=A0ACB7UCJ0_DIOAL|nr:ABI family protein [Dioscorea alata]
METLSHASSSSLLDHRRASTFDEISMHQRFLFLDTVKEMKNLRSQLYTAADHFELCYKNEKQTYIVMNNLKDYVIKAFVNTVDHLGSVSDKINALLDEKIKDVSKSEVGIVCVEQRLRTCREFTDHEGLVQQSLIIKPPKYHKHYILPAGKAIHECGTHVIRKYEESKLRKDIIDQTQTLQTVANATHGEKQLRFSKSPSISLSKQAQSSLPSPRMLSPSPSLPTGKFLFTEQRSDAMKRSGSISYRQSFRSISNIGRSYSPQPWKSRSSHAYSERNEHIEMGNGSSRNIFKSLLSRRRSRKEDVLSG